MGMTQAEATPDIEQSRQASLGGRLFGLLRPLAFGLAMASTATLFLLLTGILQVELTERRITVIVVANAALALLLLCVVTADILRLVRARRRQQPGARLHSRLVLLFTLVAAVPVGLISVVASVTIERGLNPWFAGSLRELIVNSQTIATGYQQQLCQNVGREMRFLAEDVNRAKRLGLFESQPAFIPQLLTDRARALGFSHVTVLRKDGGVIHSAQRFIEGDPEAPAEADFQAAETPEPPCLISSTFVGALMKLQELPDGFMHVARPVDARAVAFGRVADLAVQQYQVLESTRENVQRAFLVMYALIALTLLLSVLWIGLVVANWLVEPMRRLIHATDQVAGGNLYVQVPVQDGGGDVAHLGRTFNNMTARIRTQQNNLIATNEVMDRRRRFTEAVLSGVTVGIIGTDGEGTINVANPAATDILMLQAENLVGHGLIEAVPEFGALVADAMALPGRQNAQRQIVIRRNGKERTLLVRATAEHEAATGQGLIVTLDDITDLMTAQRTSAWADVARRIAHEIKNPLTPIQLSAERIKRKYGRVITEDRDVFDQCTATIIRQVDDIRRMVDEFSSFARMPKPALQPEDIVETLRQALFMMRVAHPAVTFADNLPDYAVTARFDRRLIGQAVQNVLKNATEAIAGSPAIDGLSPRIDLHLTMSTDRVISIDIIDNGKGFPNENRQRLLEPYMTERQGGTGLGLAIVAKILEDHGGGIELLDSPAVAAGGRGACVRLSFPQSGPGEAEARTREPVLSAGAPAGVPQILETEAGVSS
jgi:two-component system, NtrC family, nitrogen regulation sensor histidine kinase NtrY